MKNKILIFFPHNLFINSAGCHTRGWAIIDFFEKLNFDILLFSIKECEYYPWDEKSINLANKRFNKALIASRDDNFQEKFLNFSKENNITHTLITYYDYTYLINNDFYDNIIKICDMQDITEYSSFMYNKVSSLINNGFSQNASDISYSNKDILKYNFISEIELNKITINHENLKRYNLILCISEFEKNKLTKLNIKNAELFTYSVPDLQNINFLYLFYTIKI